jgi:hypothetical protein
LKKEIELTRDVNLKRGTRECQAGSFPFQSIIALALILNTSNHQPFYQSHFATINTPNQSA